jgi:hypothetical protein
MVIIMQALPWLAAYFGCVSTATFSSPSQHLNPFQFDGAARRGRPVQPVNIDLSVWAPNTIGQLWSGDVVVGNPPQKL